MSGFVWDHMRSRAVCARVVDERARQERKFGAAGMTCANPAMDEPTKLAVLAEEFGEVARALLEGDREGLAAELVQVAAVAVAWREALP